MSSRIPLGMGVAPRPSGLRRGRLVLALALAVTVAGLLLGRPVPPGSAPAANLVTRQRSLARQVAGLRAEQFVEQELLREGVRVRRLQELGASLKRRGLPFVAAQVVVNDPGSCRVTLGRGSYSGVGHRDVVLAPEGLVGRVVTVNETTCTAALLTDPSVGVPVRVVAREPLEARGARGDMDDDPDKDSSDSEELHAIVTGSRPNGPLVLGYLSSGAPIRVGDPVLTSGMGEIYPPGLRVGVVLAEQARRPGAPEQALVRPFVEWQKLREVLIVRRPARGARSERTSAP